MNMENFMNDIEKIMIYRTNAVLNIKLSYAFTYIHT